MSGKNKLTLAERIANRERVISGEFYVDKTGYNKGDSSRIAFIINY